MNDALVKRVESHLAGKFSLNNSSKKLIHQTLLELIERHKIETNSTPSPSIDSINAKNDNLTEDDVRIMKKHIAYGFKVVQQKNSNGPNFKSYSWNSVRKYFYVQELVLQFSLIVGSKRNQLKVYRKISLIKLWREIKISLNIHLSHTKQ